MLRQQAVGVMKDISTYCKLLNPSAINLMRSKVAGQYEIHIYCDVDERNWRCLRDIAKKHGLGIKLVDKALIIYKAGNNNGKLVQI